MRWWMTRRVERQATRMHDMMERLDVDGAALARARQGELYAQARRRCVSCGTTDKCLRWLDEPLKLGNGPDFCPNLSLFDTYRRKS